MPKIVRVTLLDYLAWSRRAAAVMQSDCPTIGGRIVPAAWFMIVAILNLPTFKAIAAGPSWFQGFICDCVQMSPTFESFARFICASKPFSHTFDAAFAKVWHWNKTASKCLKSVLDETRGRGHWMHPKYHQSFQHYFMRVLPQFSNCMNCELADGCARLPTSAEIELTYYRNFLIPSELFSKVFQGRANLTCVKKVIECFVGPDIAQTITLHRSSQLEVIGGTVKKQRAKKQMK